MLLPVHAQPRHDRLDDKIDLNEEQAGEDEEERGDDDLAHVPAWFFAHARARANLANRSLMAP